MKVPCSATIQGWSLSPRWSPDSYWGHPCSTCLHRTVSPLIRGSCSFTCMKHLSLGSTVSSYMLKPSLLAPHETIDSGFPSSLPLLSPLIDFRTFVFPISSFLLLWSFSFSFPDSFSVAHSLNNNVLGSCMFRPLFTLYSSLGIFNPLLWVNYYLHGTRCQVNIFCLLLSPWGRTPISSCLLLNLSPRVSCKGICPKLSKTKFFTIPSPTCVHSLIAKHQSWKSWHHHTLIFLTIHPGPHNILPVLPPQCPSKLSPLLPPTDQSLSITYLDRGSNLLTSLQPLPSIPAPCSCQQLMFAKHESGFTVFFLPSCNLNSSELTYSAS